MLAAVAEGERDRIRERIRDGKRHLTSQDVFNGGRSASTSSWTATVPRMVPNKAEMKVIKRMQAMRKDGATYRGIGAVTGHEPMSVKRILERMEETAS
jgi:putative DNA-invertase from lambdoid prophage Rac